MSSFVNTMTSLSVKQGDCFSLQKLINQTETTFALLEFYFYFVLLQHTCLNKFTHSSAQKKYKTLVFGRLVAMVSINLQFGHFLLSL